MTSLPYVRRPNSFSLKVVTHNVYEHFSTRHVGEDTISRVLDSMRVNCSNSTCSESVGRWFDYVRNTFPVDADAFSTARSISLLHSDRLVVVPSDLYELYNPSNEVVDFVKQRKLQIITYAPTLPLTPKDLSKV